MLSGANVVLMDQPTNHLDLESITAVSYTHLGLQYAPAQREQANGFDGPASPEAGMAGISGYLGTLCYMKKASLPWQRGFFFLLVLQHLSVAFGDSSPQGEPSHPESLPLRGGGTAQP